MLAGKTVGVIKLLEFKDKPARVIVGQTDLLILVFGRRAPFYKKGELVKKRRFDFLKGNINSS